jgi:carbon-monoxide dehydrogenase iron sulfur subunit
VPYVCTQSADAWCLQGCPVDAISVNADTGANEVTAEICVGCKVCTIACPFGTINYNSISTKVDKCDLCGGEPDCVKVCPTTALSFIEAESAGMDKMRHWAEKTDAGNQENS